jgi:hypothetical protein
MYLTNSACWLLKKWSALGAMICCDRFKSLIEAARLLAPFNTYGRSFSPTGQALAVSFA